MSDHRPVLVALLCALPLALVACSDRPPADPRTDAPVVRVATVKSTGVTALRSFSGVVAPRVQSDLGFRVPGKVIERLVDTGQNVKRGQPLMRLDRTDLALAASAQEDNVIAARARARQSADEEARYRSLRGTGAISASAYDQIKAAADTADAGLNAALAQAAAARNARRYGELLADADGIVVETLAEPGQVVASGQVVVRLARDGEREAVIQLPETLRPALGAPAQATLFGSRSAPVPATLRQLSQSADPFTRTFEARYALSGALSTAPLGATVTIRLSGQQRAVRGLTVPIGALHDAGKGPGVWLIGGTPATVSWRPVRVSQLEDDTAQVDGPLAPGDRIVALGAHLLRERQAVRFAGSAAATGGAQP